MVSGAIRATSVNRWLLILPLGSAVSLALLATTSSWSLAIALLSLAGFAYGALIAIYPFAITLQYGVDAGPAVYGRVFLAWGASGLAGPWLAGALYDAGGSYGLAAGIACLIALVSSAAHTWRLRLSERG